MARVGTSKPRAVETNVSQSAGSKASLGEVGLMAPSHERGFQKSSRALALSAGSSRLFISTRRVALNHAPSVAILLLCVFIQSPVAVSSFHVFVCLFYVVPFRLSKAYV